MGAEQTKSVIDTNIINEQVIDIMIEDRQFCAGSIAQDQSIDMEATGDINLSGTLSQKQAATLDVNCLMEAKKQAELQQVLAQVLAQKAQAERKGILPNYGSTETEIRTNIENRLRSNVNLSTVQEAVSAVVQKQKIKLRAGGNIDLAESGRIEQNMDAKATLESVLKSQGYASVIQDVKTQVENSASAKSDTQIAMGGFMLIAVALILIIAVVLYAIRGGLRFITSKKGIALIILIILLVVGGGVWIGVSSKKNKE